MGFTLTLPASSDCSLLLVAWGRLVGAHHSRPRIGKFSQCKPSPAWTQHGHCTLVCLNPLDRLVRFNPGFRVLAMVRTVPYVGRHHHPRVQPVCISGTLVVPDSRRQT